MGSLVIRIDRVITPSDPQIRHIIILGDVDIVFGCQSGNDLAFLCAVGCPKGL